MNAFGSNFRRWAERSVALYRGAAIVTIFVAGSRVYLSPEGWPTNDWRDSLIGFASHAFSLLYYWGMSLLFLLPAYVALMVWLERADLLRSPRRLLSMLVAVGAVLSLPLFAFGYGMAHTTENRANAYALAWWITAFLWLVDAACQEPRRSGR